MERLIKGVSVGKGEVKRKKALREVGDESDCTHMYTDKA